MADGEDPTLDVKVNVTADTRGAREAKAALQDIGRTATQSAGEFDRASMRHGSAFGRIITGSRNLSAAMNGVTNIMKGGIFSVGGFAQALNSLLNVVRAAAVASGPFAILALVIGTVIGVMRGLIRTTNEARSHLGGAGKATNEWVERLKQLKEESKTAMEGIRDHAKETADAYNDLNNLMEEAVARIKAVNAAQKENEEAKLAAGEASELAKATTSDERDRIRDKYRIARVSTESKFGTAQLIGDAMSADLRRKAAERVISGVQASRFPLESEAARTGQQAAVAKEIAQAEYQRALETGTVPWAGFLANLTGMETPEERQSSRAFQRARQTAMPAIEAGMSAREAQARLKEFDEKNRETLEKARKAISQAETARSVSTINIDTAGVDMKARREAEKITLRERQAEIEARSKTEVQRIQGELSTLTSQRGVMGNSFDPGYVALERRIAELQRAAEAIPAQTSNAIGALGDAYRKNMREMQKLQSQIDAGRSYTTGQ